MSDKWGIEVGAWDWEEARLLRSQTNPTQLPDNTVTEEPVLVDHRGRPLVMKRPRPIGFRRPDAAVEEATRP